MSIPLVVECGKTVEGFGGGIVGKYRVFQERKVLVIE